MLDRCLQGRVESSFSNGHFTPVANKIKYGLGHKFIRKNSMDIFSPPKWTHLEQ